jgi:hypothetical protein
MKCGYLQGAAVEYDGFRIAVFMIRVEYMKKQLRRIGSEMPFSICCLFLKKLYLLSGIPDLQYIHAAVIGT